MVQPKLAVNAPGDRYEQEADAMASRVVQSPRNLAGMAMPRLSAVGSANGGMMVPAKLAGQLLQPGAGGAALSPSTRSVMETAFSTDFTQVRIHASDEAAQMNQQLGAKAFTHGSDIYFDRGQYVPEQHSGQELLAHELSHVVQQQGGVDASVSPIQRQPSPQTPLTDPVSASSATHGFYLIGPDFSAMPADADIRQILAETGVSDASTLATCIPKVYTVATGNVQYIAYENPTLGVVARAFSSWAGKKQAQGSGTKGQYTNLFGVYAYLPNADATKYRNVGAGGPLRDPLPVLDAVAGAPTGSFADLQAQLSLLDTRLKALAVRYPANDPFLGPSIADAQQIVQTMRGNLTALPDQAMSIETAVQLIEWVDYDLELIDKQSTQLTADGARQRSLFRLKRKYGQVVNSLLAPNALGLYQEAQLLAERLPADLMLDAMRKHGEINDGPLVQSTTLVQWTDDLRKRLGTLYDKRKIQLDNPNDATITKEVAEEAGFIEMALRGMQLFAQWLVAFETMVSNRPGILDTPLISAMNRLRDRVVAIKDAYDKGNMADLKKRVEKMESDTHIAEFYQSLPAAMQVTQMIGRVGLATFAALATGGIGGLVAGGARTAAAGLTVGRAVAFVGTAVLEAATFTTVNAAGSAFFFGDKISFGSLLKDFAWNLGLFAVLRGVSGISGSALRAAELKILNGPVQLTGGFAAAHGWGVLRFRTEQGRWPTKAEFDQMTATSLIMMAGIMVGSKATQRWIASSKRAKALSVFQRDYGWRFEALDTLRNELGTRLIDAETKGKGNDQAEVATAQGKAQTLEKNVQDIMKDVLNDKRFKVEELRQELNQLSTEAPDIASELISTSLGLPAELGIRRAGKASYTYGNGETSTLKESLSSNYTVSQEVEPGTGLKRLTATSPSAPTLVFVERSAGVIDFNTSTFDIQKLMTELSVTSVGAQRLLWRLLSENGVATNPKKATIDTRQAIKKLVAKTGESADDTLSDLYKTGRVRSAARPELATAADTLESKDILKSPEWLEARSLENQRGVVGEWLAKEAVPPTTGQQVLRRVTIQGDIFTDKAGTVLATGEKGNALTNATAAETDLIYAQNKSGTFEVEQIVNVKASGAKGMAKSASVQNSNFKALLGAKPGDLAEVLIGGQKRYVRIRAITAYDGNTQIVLTGKVKLSSGSTLETVGPKGAGGFSKTMSQVEKDVTTITSVLAEKQLIGSGQY